METQDLMLQRKQKQTQMVSIKDQRLKNQEFCLGS